MGKIKATQKITIEFHANSESLADEFESYINGLYDKVEFELDYGKKDDDYVLRATETANGWYDPPVYYTKNGDGFPGCKEIDYEIWEDDLMGICRDFSGKYDDENIFCIDSCICEDIDY